MFACNCVGVTEEEVLELVDKKFTIEEIMEELRVATCCGTCYSFVEELIERGRNEARED